MDKIFIVSQVSGTILLIDSEAKVNRTFKKKGQKHFVTADQWDIIQFNEGFNYMLNQGMLYVETPEAKKDTPIEEFEKIDENLIRHCFLEITPSAFEAKVKNFGQEILEEFVQYAVTNKIMDYEKNSILKKLCGLDIGSIIRSLEEDK